MEDINIILEDGTQSSVKGIFYIFNSKYYFMYTKGESVDNDYTQLYIVQIFKEVQNTPNGSVDTGFMQGVETSDSEEWKLVQKSITEIVEDKKREVKSAQIQYLPINTLTNLKIVSKNKFKLVTKLLNELFNVSFGNVSNQGAPQVENTSVETQQEENENSDMIIDYRVKFFEEQDKNKELEDKIKQLEEKINNIKTIIE